MSLLVNSTVDEWGGITYTPTAAGFTAIVLAILALMILGCGLFGQNQKLSTRQLSVSSLAIALGVITSMIELIHMPMGGSVTLFSMLFIALIGYWNGLRTGIMTAVAYGLLQMLINPYIISVPQMICDYLLAFGALGLSGLFRHSAHGLLKGYLAAVLGRYCFSVLSGWIFFGTYASDFGFRSAFLYSLAYNGAYLGLEALFTVILICIPSVRNALGYVRQFTAEDAEDRNAASRHRIA
ncbi:energy-coupled thiamine transporter ThiT [[Clostridium] aminophilum]|uniref:energy-coupled thiamine transporter ThiT n=1 Tax=[Clostridium] aminophilum TaxID=1526 RepID=UPI00331A375B